MTMNTTSSRRPRRWPSTACMLMTYEKISQFIDSCEEPSAPFWKKVIFGLYALILVGGFSFCCLYFIYLFS